MRKIALFFAILLFMDSCNNVTVPPANLDQAPIITIGVSNGTSSANYTTPATINVAAGTTLQYIISAYNSKGGVKSLVFTIPDESKTLTATGAPDASGNVPVQLNLATYNGYKISDVYNIGGFTETVTATATNFNGMVSILTLTIPVAVNPPKIVSLQFDPNSVGTPGYVNLGQSTKLNWVVNCEGCNISIKAFDGNGFTHQTIDATHLPSPNGSLTVVPEEQFTNYNFTATNSAGTASQTIQEQIFVPTQRPNLTAYFFQVSNSNYCWTQSIVASDPTTAINEVRAWNGGMQVSQITESQFLSGSVCNF